MLAGVRGDNPDAQLRYAAFLEELRKLGWINGQNVQVEVRWSGGDAKLMRQYAAIKRMTRRAPTPAHFGPSQFWLIFKLAIDLGARPSCVTRCAH
jgi:hypothetical protein